MSAKDKGAEPALSSGQEALAEDDEPEDDEGQDAPRGGETVDHPVGLGLRLDAVLVTGRLGRIERIRGLGDLGELHRDPAGVGHGVLVAEDLTGRGEVAHKALELPDAAATGHGILELVSGDFDTWRRVSRTFLDDLRKQFLAWRALSLEDRETYVAEFSRWVGEMGDGR